MRLSAAQRRALLHMLENGGRCSVGFAPCTAPTMQVLRRLGLTEHHDTFTHQEAYAVAPFGREYWYRTVVEHVERLTDDGRRVAEEIAA